MVVVVVVVVVVFIIAGVVTTSVVVVVGIVVCFSSKELTKPGRWGEIGNSAGKLYCVGPLTSLASFEESRDWNEPIR